MTQKEIDFLYNITLLIHEDDWFGKRKKGTKRDREEVQAWVAKMLAQMGIYTIPIGMSWGVLVEKHAFDEYWNKNLKTKDENEK